MPNPENLTNRTPEQKFQDRSKGGIARAKQARARKSMKEELTILLSLPVKKSIGKEVQKLLSVDKAKALSDFAGKNTTVQTQMLLKLTQMAMNGNLKAMQLILDLSGEVNQKTVDTSALDRLDNILGGLNKAAYEDDN
jgi:hypothetical protein